MRKLVCLLFVLSLVSVQPQLLGGLLVGVGSLVNGLVTVTLNLAAVPSSLTAGQYLPITSGNCGCSSSGGTTPVTLTNGVLELTNGLLGGLLGTVKNVVVAVVDALTVAIATLKVTASQAFCLVAGGAQLVLGVVNVVAVSATKGAVLTIAGLAADVRSIVNIGALTCNNAGAQVAVNGLIDLDLDLCTLNGGTLAVGAGVNLNAAVAAGVGVLSILGPVGVKLGAALNVGAGLSVNGNGTLNVAGLLAIDASARVNTALNILPGGILACEGSGINILGVINVGAGGTIVIDTTAAVAGVPILGNVVLAAGANIKVKVDSVSAVLAKGIDLAVLSHLIADINALASVNLSLFDCYGSVLSLNVSLNAFADFATSPCQALVTSSAIKVRVVARV